MDWPGRISLIGFSIGSVTWYNKRVHWLWGLCGIQLMTTRTSMMICNKFMPLLTIVYSRRFISCSNSPHTPGSHRGVSFSCVYHLYPISWQVSFVLLLVFFLWKVSYLWFSYVVCVDISMDRFFNLNYLLIIHSIGNFRIEMSDISRNRFILFSFIWAKGVSYWKLKKIAQAKFCIIID